MSPCLPARHPHFILAALLVEAAEGCFAKHPHVSFPICSQKYPASILRQNSLPPSSSSQQAVRQTGPQGQDSQPYPTHSCEKTVAEWDTGLHLPFPPGSSEGAGRREMFIEHLLYVWQVLKHGKIECPGPGTFQGMRVSTPSSCVHFKDILTGGTARLLRAPATKSDRRQIWGWGGRSSSSTQKMGDLGQVT